MKFIKLGNHIIDISAIVAVKIDTNKSYDVIVVDTKDDEYEVETFKDPYDAKKRLEEIYDILNNIISEIKEEV